MHFLTMENGVISSKDVTLHGGERHLGWATFSHRHFFVSRSVEDGTRCWGCLDYCHQLGTVCGCWSFLSLLDILQDGFLGGGDRIVVTRVGTASLVLPVWRQLLGFGGSFMGWPSEGSSGQLLGVLGRSLEFGRSPVLVKSSQELKICPIF